MKMSAVVFFLIFSFSLLLFSCNRQEKEMTYAFSGYLHEAVENLRGPKGLAVDSKGNIYISDSWNNRVLKLDPSGKLINTFGGEDDKVQLSGPTGLAVDKFGNVFICDNGNNRILKLNPEGTLVSEFGSSGDGKGQFNGPTGIGIDSRGNVYVSDLGNDRVQKFSPLQP